MTAGARPQLKILSRLNIPEDKMKRFILAVRGDAAERAPLRGAG